MAIETHRAARQLWIRMHIPSFLGKDDFAIRETTIMKETILYHTSQRQKL
jgi:hypothetical protein